MTQYRQAGNCFMLSDGFDDVFSTDIDVWVKVWNHIKTSAYS